MLGPESLHNKRILISALNWGYGHLSRCIPLVNQLIKQGNTIYFASEESAFSVIRSYCDHVQFVAHKPYPFRFGFSPNFRRDIFLRFPRLLLFLKKEARYTQYLVEDLAIDVVISDHRYGFFSKKCVSVIICHQLQLPLGRGEKWLQLIHEKLLGKFDYVWVPDKVGSPLSGELSAVVLNNLSINFIGWLSRFDQLTLDYQGIDKLENIILLSGPKQYHSELIDRVLESSGVTSNELNIIGWDIDGELLRLFPNVNFYSVSSWKELDFYMISANTIYTRSGYSTLMDAKFLNARFIFFPTPSQSEQIYLAKRS